MRYVTINELVDIIRQNIWKIPHNVDVVIGIPRSGMLPATIIALFLNTRLTDIDSFVKDGIIYSNGLSRGEYVNKAEIKNVLVVDDSINSGRSMLDARKKLEIIQMSYNYFFCTPIATSKGATMVDISFEIIDETRVFEWNIFHHTILNNSCVDIDGVLCLDPIEDDDGVKYIEFLNNAKPLFTPTCKINTLITCRLEKYRDITEQWLLQNNIKYDNLIMLPFPNKETRVAWNKHGYYKGNYFKHHPECILFIESSFSQAQLISEISEKPVYCVETNSLIHIKKNNNLRVNKLNALREHLPHIYDFLKRTYHIIIK